MLKKRIPTIVGLLLLIIGAMGGVMFISQGTDFLPRAAPEYAPQKVKITNLTENSMTISWITEEPTIGFVKFSDSAANLSQTAIDDRDQLTGSSSEYRTHYITLQGLTPSTPYYFKLGSQKNQLYDNNGQPFSINTPSALGTPPPADTAYGTVITQANTPAEGSIVYLSMEGATPVSGLVKQSGNWAAVLSTARTPDLSAYVIYEPSSKIDILVQPATGEIAKAITTAENDKPVPTITLGQEHNFAGEPDLQEEPLESSDPLKESEPTPEPVSKFTFQEIEAVESNETVISITSIPEDGAEIDTPTPDIGGRGPSGETLTITVHSNQAYTDQVAVGDDGTWEWTPPGNLEPGDHTVVVSYTDAEGILHKVSRHFVVNAAEPDSLDEGDVPEYSATPSATIKPTPKPSPTPLETVLPTPRTTVATEAADMQAGNLNPTIAALLAGLACVLGGLFLNRKKSVV